MICKYIDKCENATGWCKSERTLYSCDKAMKEYIKELSSELSATMSANQILKEKLKPKEPNCIYEDEAMCPCCGDAIDETDSYMVCVHCGQVIDWRSW